MRVYATGGGLSYFVASKEAMDEALSNGLDIRTLSDDGKDELLATPDSGYLKEPPELEHKAKKKGGDLK